MDNYYCEYCKKKYIRKSAFNNHLANCKLHKLCKTRKLCHIDDSDIGLKIDLNNS